MALDIEVSPELRKEGLAREIINRVQNIRKNRGYDITDHITLVFEPSEEVESTVSAFGEYIATQVLADAVAVAALPDGNGVEVLDIDGLIVKARIEKV